jgi:hypothetical protein
MSQMSFKPDYGFQLVTDGIAPTTDLFFYDFCLNSISVLGPSNYSTTVEHRYRGTWHALSLDFNEAQLQEILARTTPEVADSLRAELRRDPASARSIDLPGQIIFSVRARFGKLQTAEKEQFVPLVVHGIL